MIGPSSIYINHSIFLFPQANVDKSLERKHSYIWTKEKVLNTFFILAQVRTRT